MPPIDPHGVAKNRGKQPQHRHKKRPIRDSVGVTTIYHYNQVVKPTSVIITDFGRVTIVHRTFNTILIIVIIIGIYQML